MAQQPSITTLITKPTTIIEDLQSLSSKILDLSKTDKLPENDAIELNNDLLKIYKKINNPTLPNTHTHTQITHIIPHENVDVQTHSQGGQTYQTGLTYTYTYNVNDNDENDDNDDEEEEQGGEVAIENIPRGNITISTTITPTLITPLSYNLLLENSYSTTRRL